MDDFLTSLLLPDIWGIVQEYLAVYEITDNTIDIAYSPVSMLLVNPRIIDSIIRIQTIIDLDAFSKNPNFIWFVKNYIESINWDIASHYPKFLNAIAKCRFCADLPDNPLIKFAKVYEYYATTIPELRKIKLSGFDVEPKNLFENPANVGGILEYFGPDFNSMDTEQYTMFLYNPGIPENVAKKILSIVGDVIGGCCLNPVLASYLLERNDSTSRLFLPCNKNPIILDHGIIPCPDNPLILNYNLANPDKIKRFSGRNPEILKLLELYTQEYLSDRSDDFWNNPEIFVLVKPSLVDQKTTPPEHPGMFLSYLKHSAPELTIDLLNDHLFNWPICRFSVKDTIHGQIWIQPEKIRFYKKTKIDMWRLPYTYDDLEQEANVISFLGVTKNIKLHLARYRIDRKIFIELHGTDKHACYAKFMKMNKKQLEDELFLLKLPRSQGHYEKIYTLMVYTSNMLI
jgi:hypothetical protein